MGTTKYLGYKEGVSKVECPLKEVTDCNNKVG